MPLKAVANFFPQLFLMPPPDPVPCQAYILLQLANLHFLAKKADLLDHTLYLFCLRRIVRGGLVRQLSEDSL